MEKQIQEYIHANRQEMLDLLKRLVEIESYSGSKEGVNNIVHTLLPELEKIGLKPEIIPGKEYGDHIYAHNDAAVSPRLLFMGHMDTVYPNGTGWPFTIENGKAFGPGVLDMKGGIVILIYALKALQASGSMPFSTNILFNSDEEPGSHESRLLLPKYARNIDYAFVLEPAETGGLIVTERKGVGIFNLSVTGKAAHAGQEPEKGINANRELAHQIIAIENLANPEEGTTVNAGWMQGGTAPYVISEQAEARIDVRVKTLEERERIEDEIDECAHVHHVKGTTINVSGGFHRPPMVCLPGAKILIDSVRYASDVIRQEIGFSMSGAASDANNLVDMNIPTIDGMGPVGGRAHSRDEYIELESLFERTILLAITLDYLIRKTK